MTRRDTLQGVSPGFEIRGVKGGDYTLDLLIYGTIGNTWYGDVNAADLVKELAKHKAATTINVFINSTGGDVFAGQAIYSALARHSARVVVTIDGLAASIAALVAMAGDEIFIAQNAMMMIHDPYAWAAGSADELRKQAELMDKVKDAIVTVYAARSSLNDEQVTEMMTEETWFTAAEAVDAGLADSIVEAKKMAACGDLSFFKKTPAELRAVSSDQKDNAPNKEKQTMAGDNDKGATPQPGATSTAEKQTADTAQGSTPPTATVAELKTAFPTADNDFVVECLQKNLTLSAAKDAWSAKITADLEAKDKEIATLKEGGKARAGVTALGVRSGAASEGAETDGDAKERFMALVKVKVDGGMPKHKAISAVAAEEPELHAEYLNAYNARYGHPGIS